MNLSKNKRPIYHNRRVSFEEYQNLKYDGFQYEIIEGVMKVVPAPSDEHQVIEGALYRKLANFLDNNPIGIVRIAPRDVKFDENLIYQPDILFISKERLSINKRKYVDGPPDFIIEVLSKGTLVKDIRYKFSDYERYGVKEYWIIDPDNLEKSEFFYLKEGKYEPIEYDGNIVKSKVIEGFEIDLEELERSKKQC